MSRPLLFSPSSQLFSARLASRILALVGAASLAVPEVSCTGKLTTATSTSGGSAGASSAAGTGGAGGAGAAGGATGTGGSILSFDAGIPEGGLLPPPPVADCFDWPLDAGACPTDQASVLFIFDMNGCVDGGSIEPSEVISGPGIDAGDPSVDAGDPSVDAGDPSVDAGDPSVDAGDPPAAANQCCYVVQMQYCLQGGRPYLVAERARISAATRGTCSDGWSEGDRPRLDGLTAGERAALAAAWTADALAEHASVASFARFSLSLLAAGAPADLVELAHRAALDEVQHARLCFALATAYAGEPVAPGPFPTGDRIDVDASLAALAASTVREGCIGETVAAIVATEQLARATDPAVQRALAQIAADEARHAELAWRTVAWAVEAGGRLVRDAVERAFLAAPHPPASGSAASEAHGRLDAATTAQVIAGALRDVVAPCARALLSSSASKSRNALGCSPG